jgi:signal transduction histidine kinase
MRDQVLRLQKLTTDLLDLSRLDAGSLEIRLEAVSLLSLAQSVAEEFFPAAALKGSTIHVPDGDGAVDIEAICDPQRTAQIVRILLDNALRHTPEGTPITIDAGSSGTAPRGTARLAVIDEGPGIDPSQLPYVFDRFHSGDSAGGSGLGLAIALQLARRMEGALEVTSEPGRTVFTLSLPLAGAAPARPARARATAPARTGAGREA